MLTRLGLGGSYLLNRDSPLLRQNSGTSAGIGLMWTWKRSSQQAWGGEE